ncbi:hypothetical protein MASR2M18_05880 [Ignavibacteria bacterium]
MKRHYSQLALTTGRGVPLTEQTESEVQAAVIELLRKAGYMVIRFNSGGFRDGKRFVSFYHVFGSDKPASGFPDVAAFKGAKCLLLEVKRRRGKVSEAQEQFRRYAAQHGVTVAIVRDVSDALQIIESERNR